MMKRSLAFCCFLMLMPLVLAGSGDAQPNESVLKAFERFKALEGSWTGTNSQGEDVRVDYQLTGNGTAVLERFHVEGQQHSHDMTTLYYLDNGRLALTHYCVVGNQPHMASAKGLVGKQVEFDFVAVGNADPSKDGHMHHALFEFEGQDAYNTTWTFYEDGKAKFAEKLVMDRSK